MASNKTTINKEIPKVDKAGASTRSDVDTRTEIDSDGGSFRDAKSPSKMMEPPVEDPAVRFAHTILMKVLGSGKTADAALTRVVSPEDVYTLLDYVKPIFMIQPSCLELKAGISICGDIHGQFSGLCDSDIAPQHHFADLLRVFDKAGFPGRANYLFLGDYVDRGKNCLETILLLFSYKIILPNTFFLLRGNHECPMINKQYGFYDECQRRYKVMRVWEAFQDIFAWMPLTALLGERILCMHGGLSPTLRSIDQLRAMKRPNYQPESPSLEIDILWSDPSNFHKTWASNSRGVSYVFGPDGLRRVLADLNIDLVVRAHQVVQDGYEFFASRRLVTVFTAPFYCGQFDNAAAVMNISHKLVCSFMILRPRKKVKLLKRNFRRLVPKKQKVQPPKQ